MSRLHDGQLRGSFMESSGWGSKIIAPSGVFFFSSIERPDSRLLDGGLELIRKGEGSDEAEVLAGAICQPRGSLRLVFDMSRTVPKDTAQVSTWKELSKHSRVNCSKFEQRTNDVDVPPWACGHRSTIYVPGTSSVSLSFKTPRLHFSSLDLTSSCPSEDTAEPEGSGFGLPKNLRHVGILDVIGPSRPTVISCFSPSTGSMNSDVVPMKAGNDRQ